MAPRRHKLDRAALASDVRDYPDAYQYEQAARLGVSTKATWYARGRLTSSERFSVPPCLRAFLIQGNID